MAKTVMMETFALHVQRALEDILSSKEPVILARGGQPLGHFEAYTSSEKAFEEITPEEITDILAAIQQGEADYTAGKYITLEAFETKYADLLGEDAK